MRKNGQSTNIVEFEIYNAYFYPLSIFFMTFIGAIMGSIYRRGGIMIFFFLCVFLCLVYVTIMAIGKILGHSNVITPLTGALLPHILSILILSVVYIRK
jgi:lipopolysaccharide export LptBFGC system permease protein LptF